VDMGEIDDVNSERLMCQIGACAGLKGFYVKTHLALDENLSRSGLAQQLRCTTPLPARYRY